MDKIKETYETASWIFRELITLRKFRNMIKFLSKTQANPEDLSANKDFTESCDFPKSAKIHNERELPTS